MLESLSDKQVTNVTSDIFFPFKRQEKKKMLEYKNNIYYKQFHLSVFAYLCSIQSHACTLTCTFKHIGNGNEGKGGRGGEPDVDNHICILNCIGSIFPGLNCTN